MNETRPRRMTLEEKLARLGISDTDLDFYFELFAQNPQRYMIKMNDGNWQVIKSKTGRFVKLDRHVAAYHLLSRYWVATFAPEVPRYLCIDIDASESLLS